MADSPYRPRFTKVLTTMLDALQKQETQLRDTPGRPAIPLKQLLETPDGVLALEDYERDPIGMAFRAGLREIGKASASLMSLDEMRVLAEDAARVSGNYEFRHVTLDRIWDGIRTANLDELQA